MSTFHIDAPATVYYSQINLALSFLDKLNYLQTKCTELNICLFYYSFFDHVNILMEKRHT